MGVASTAYTSVTPIHVAPPVPTTVALVTTTTDPPVNGRSTTTTLGVSPNSAVGVPGVAPFVTVSPNTSTGTVAFTDNGAAVPACGTVPVRSGAATCVTAFTTSGVHSIEAVYNGDTASASSSGYTVVSVAPTANFFRIALGYLIPFAHFFHLVGF